MVMNVTKNQKVTGSVNIDASTAVRFGTTSRRGWRR